MIHDGKPSARDRASAMHTSVDKAQKDLGEGGYQPGTLTEDILSISLHASSSSFCLSHPDPAVLLIPKSHLNDTDLPHQL